MTEASAIRRGSLRRRLLVTLIGTVAVIWLATAGVSYLDARHRVNELLDAHLAQSAALLVAQTGQELEEIDTEHAPLLHKYGRRVAFQVWEHGEVLRLHSVNAPPHRLSAREDGFSDTTVDGRSWRVFSSWDGDHHYLVQVAERAATRERIAADIGRNLLVPLLIAVPLLGLLVWLSVVRGTRPLLTLGQEVERRDPLNVAPLDIGGVPSEIAPLVASLNSLFSRVATLIEHERRFTADAAHELRTPIAALRAQAQVALAAASDAERQRALDMVLSGCDRIAHLVSQLLTLARLEPVQSARQSGTCELRAVAKEVVAELVPAALAKNVDIELDTVPSAMIAGEPALVAVLLRNLIDNAVRYSPNDTVVRVALDARDGFFVLAVTDQGGGVSPDLRFRLGERFFRIAGSDAPGSGLGLSIVRRIAELHGASVQFGEGSDGKGLRATVTLPAAPQARSSGKPSAS